MRILGKSEHNRFLSLSLTQSTDVKGSLSGMASRTSSKLVAF